METRTFIIATNGRLKWWLQHTLEDLSPEQLDYRTPLIVVRLLLHSSAGIWTDPSGQPFQCGRYRSLLLGLRYNATCHCCYE